MSATDNRNGLVGNWAVFLLKMPSLFLGLFLFAAGVVANLYSGLGMSPWGVLGVGLTNHTSLTFGQANQLVGLVVLVVGWLLSFPPGAATLANIYFIGYFIDLIIEWRLLPVTSEPLIQFLMLFLSVGLIGVASLLYLRVQLGAGPRDGLMMGLHRRLNKPISFIRGTIEVTVLALGWLLGGPIGIGTLITALIIGYSIQFAFRIGKFDSQNSEHMNLYRLVESLSGHK
jgi:uncharacterized membrane protein YczE